MTDRIGVRREAWLLVAGGLVAIVALYVRLEPWNLHDRFFVSVPMGRDFANFWLAPTLALEGRLSALFDTRAYNEAVAQTFAHVDDWMVFSYPPTTLLFLLPLALMPFWASLAVWSLLNLAAFAATARLLGASRGLTAVATLSPAVAVATIYGHFGGALALAGTLALRIAETQPAAAGALVALTGVKPQFGVMFGLVLLLSGRWRCVAWAGGFGALIVGASVAVLGVEPWHGFLTWTLPLHRVLLDRFRDFDFLFLHAVTLYVAGKAADLPTLGLVLQVAFGLAAVGGAVVALRRHGPTPRVVALIFLACALGLSYGSHYDLAVAVPALAIALFGDEPDPSGARSPGTFVRVTLWLAPTLALPLAQSGIPILPPILAGCVLALAWPMIRPAPRTAASGNTLFTTSPLYG